MASNTRLPPKKDVALALLEQSTVFVHLDPREEVVRVPVWFKKQPQLVLQIGLNMAIPIPDLDVGEEGIACTLSFNRTPHGCWIPWASVFALVGDNGRGMVWPEDVPQEVAAQAAQQQRTEEKPALRAVPSKSQQKATPSRSESKSETKEGKETKPRKKRVRKAAKEGKAATPRASGRSGSARAAADSLAAVPSPGRATSSGASGASTTDNKRRRALPPYLRVIK